MPFVRHVHSMCMPCVPHVYVSHANPMCMPCAFHVYPMWPCVFHVYGMPCVCHVYSMCMPCVFHVHAMCRPCVRQTIEPNSSPDCVCNDNACDVRRYRTHTHTHIHLHTHMLASPHTPHTDAYPPASLNQASTAKQESPNNSHHTTYKNNHAHRDKHLPGIFSRRESPDCKAPLVRVRVA